MKRKRQASHDQSLKEQENSSSTKSFKSNITGKLQTLLNGFVSELQSISEDKRQDVALLFSPQYKESNGTEDPSSVKSAFPSLANSPDSTKVLQNFIDSAKSRISGLLSNKQKSQISGGNNFLKNFQSPPQPKKKSSSIDPLEIQINLKFQSLLFKAFDTKKANHVNENQEITTSESIITEKDWQDLSRMLQDFSESSRWKIHTSLTRERNNQFLNGSVSVQNSPVKESQSSRNTQPSIISQRISQNKELKESSVNQGNSSCPLGSDSNKLTKKNAKLLKMDSSSESTNNSSSPRNPFDEGCMLLLSDAEKCPKYVDLQFSSESDLDEQEDIEPPNSNVHKSESEDEVIVLGEKSKTYQEVTLEEDDDGQVRESVIEKVVEKCPKKEKGIEELVFNCSQCDKSFRVQSLLQFHIKMHNTENPSSKASEYHCPNSSSSSEDESNSLERPSNLNQRMNEETSEERKKRMNRERMRRWRARQTQEKLQSMNDHVKERKRHRIENETPDERVSRQAHNTEQRRRLRLAQRSRIVQSSSILNYDNFKDIRINEHTCKPMNVLESSIATSMLNRS